MPARPTPHPAARAREAAPPRAGRSPLSRREIFWLLGIFGVALALRLLYVIQISKAPFFNYPMGDGRLHFVRAREILAGDFLGREVFFHSAPVYPYFIALCLRLAGGLGGVYVVQAVLGASDCVLIALAARRIAGVRALPVAGLAAAAYGLFAFFDGDLLMIPLTLVFFNAAFLLLLRAHETDSTWLALLAGFCFAAAALDRVNLLVFAPVAMLFLASGLSRRPARWRPAPALVFLAAIVATVAPVTLRNAVVGHDLVLVSSNGGVNLFIGNSAGANGRFVPPPGSGLTDPGLKESSQQEAGKALGREVRPSEASRYWAGRAVSFMLSDPAAALSLFGLKSVLLVNAYEVPNQMNYYFVRSEYAPLLRWMVVGFGLVAPLGLGGLALLRPWRDPAGRLLVLFLAVYALTVVAFFVTERYRLPLVPGLIVLASGAIVGTWDALRNRRFRALVPAGAVVLPAVLLVNLPTQRFDFNLDRAYNAAALYQAAMENPRQRAPLLPEAVRGFKWVLEEKPDNALARFGLAVALEQAGHLDDARRELQTLLAATPDYPGAGALLRRIESRRVSAPPPTIAIPPTPYEEALAAARAGHRDAARRQLEDLLARDPFHAPARAELATLARGTM